MKHGVQTESKITNYKKRVKIVMVNNSTNISKTHNHLSPQTIEHEKTPRHMTLEIQDLTWDRHKNMTGFSRSMECIIVSLKKSVELATNFQKLFVSYDL